LLIAPITGLAIIGLFGVSLWKLHIKARLLSIIAIAIILIGIGALAQPWMRLLYRNGLNVLMTGIGSYILVSHFE
jgi:hypothetical protein